MIPARQVYWQHGAGAPAKGAPYATVAGILGSGARIVAPQLGETEPDLWGSAVAETLDALPEDAVLIGHSLGASVLLQVLAGRRPGRRAPAVFAFAAPFWGPSGWDFAGFALPEGADAALSGVGAIHFYHGTADDVVDPSHSALYARAFPGARCRLIEGANHVFSGCGLAEFADDLAAAGWTT